MNADTANFATKVAIKRKKELNLAAVIELITEAVHRGEFFIDIEVHRVNDETKKRLEIDKFKIKPFATSRGYYYQISWRD